MRAAGWMVGAAVALSACMPTGDAPVDEPAAAVAELPVRLSGAEVDAANDAAACTSFDDEGATARHLDEDAPPADRLYERRPAAAGDHLGAWVDARVYGSSPDERAVVHNHEHGAVSVWYVPDTIADDELDLLRAWARSRNERLANDAGAGVIVAPFPEGLADGATVAFRAWSGGLDCRRFDPVVADGVLLDRFGHAPEGTLAPDLDGVLDRATAA